MVTGDFLSAPPAWPGTRRIFVHCTIMPGAGDRRPPVPAATGLQRADGERN